MSALRDWFRRGPVQPAVAHAQEQTWDPVAYEKELDQLEIATALSQSAAAEAQRRAAQMDGDMELLYAKRLSLSGTPSRAQMVSCKLWETDRCGPRSARAKTLRSHDTQVVRARVVRTPLR